MDIRTLAALRTLAWLALAISVALLANQLVATRAAHAHHLANPSEAALDGAESGRTPGEAHDARHCEGCCSRPDAEQRQPFGPPTAASAAPDDVPLPSWEPEALGDRRLAARLAARGPPQLR